MGKLASLTVVLRMMMVLPAQWFAWPEPPGCVWDGARSVGKGLRRGDGRALETTENSGNASQSLIPFTQL